MPGIPTSIKATSNGLARNISIALAPSFAVRTFCPDGPAPWPARGRFGHVVHDQDGVAGDRLACVQSRCRRQFPRERSNGAGALGTRDDKLAPRAGSVARFATAAMQLHELFYQCQSIIPPCVLGPGASARRNISGIPSISPGPIPSSRTRTDTRSFWLWTSSSMVPRASELGRVVRGISEYDWTDRKITVDPRAVGECTMSAATKSRSRRAASTA